MGKLTPDVTPRLQLRTVVSDAYAQAGRPGNWSRIALGTLLVAAVAIAHPYTLAGLVRQPSAALVALAFGLLVGVASVARARTLGPDINDHATDLIVGLPILAVAIWMLQHAPAQLSSFTWLWRLDLLSIPFFAAGAIALLFGVRMLWAQRVALGILALPWLLVVAGVADSRVVISAAAMALGALTLAVALSAGGQPQEQTTRGVPQAAIVLLLAAIVLSGVLDVGLQRFQPLFTSGGKPAITESGAIRPVAGWLIRDQGTYDWIQQYLNPQASWHRFSYTPLNSGDSPLWVDAISVTNYGDLSSHQLDEFFRLHGERLVASRSVPLDDGIVASIVSYAGPPHQSSWTALYWDWPVASGSAIQYQRIVISSAGLRIVHDDALVNFANQLVRAALIKEHQ